MNMNIIASSRLTRPLALTPINHRPTKQIVDITVPREPVKKDATSNPNVIKFKRTLRHRWRCDSSREKAQPRPHMRDGASQLRLSSKPALTFTSFLTGDNAEFSTMKLPAV